MPPLYALPRGCAFHPRCRYAQAPCTEAVPPLRELRPGRRAACIRHAQYQVDVP